jgi:long-chain fatty acid transport protein
VAKNANRGEGQRYCPPHQLPLQTQAMRTNGDSPFLAVSIALASMAFASPCSGAGPWLSESGGADTGMAGAGRAAMALDAASLAANPAAMGGLPRGTVTMAAMPLKLDFDFQGAGDTPAHATNEDGINTVPALYAVHRSDRLTWGIGAYSYLGLSFDAGNQWAGRRVVEKAGLATFNIAPAVAWSATDRLTVGAAIAAQLAEPEARIAVANDAIYFGPPVGLPDGQLELSGDSWAAGGQLGLLYAPRDNLRVGLAWTAPVDHSAGFDVEANGLHPVLAPLLPADGDARIVFTLPQQLLLGVTHRAGDDTTLSLGLSWQDWSTFGESRLMLAGQSSPVFASGLRDTWGAAIGVRQPMAQQWTASAGVNYESSPAPDGGVPAYFPVAEQWRIAAGAERSISDALRLRAEMSVVLQGDADVAQTAHPLPLPGIPQLTGTYDNTRVYMIALAADFLL